MANTAKHDCRVCRWRRMAGIAAGRSRASVPTAGEGAGRTATAAACEEGLKLDKASGVQ